MDVPREDYLKMGVHYEAIPNTLHFFQSTEYVIQECLGPYDEREHGMLNCPKAAHPVELKDKVKEQYSNTRLVAARQLEPVLRLPYVLPIGQPFSEIRFWHGRISKSDQTVVRQDFKPLFERSFEGVRSYHTDREDVDVNLHDYKIDYRSEREVNFSYQSDEEDLSSAELHIRANSTGYVFFTPEAMRVFVNDYTEDMFARMRSERAALAKVRGDLNLALPTHYL